LGTLDIGRAVYAVYEARIAPRRGPIAGKGHRSMSPSSAATAATRYLLVSLFFPFSALDKILNHKGAVAQAREILPEGPARLAILAGLGIEIVMPLAILTGVADRLAASVMAGYCGATALLWKRFWRPGDFWQAGHSQGRELFWDFLKNFSLAGGFLLITFGTKRSEMRDFLSHPLRSSHPYKLPESLR
jgi:putative oxidoreductase